MGYSIPVYAMKSLWPIMWPWALSTDDDNKDDSDNQTQSMVAQDVWQDLLNKPKTNMATILRI